MRMFIGSTVCRNTAFSFGIRLTTGIGFCKLAPWNHSFVAFKGIDCDPDIEDGADAYIESWFRTNPDSGHDGIQGPIPLDDLISWQEHDTANREYVLQPLPYPPDVCRHAYIKARAMVGKVGYADLQIWHNLTRGIFGLPSLPALRSHETMTCSEFAAWIWHIAHMRATVLHGNKYHGVMFSDPLEEFLQIGTRNTFDDVAPSGQIGLHEAVKSYRDAMSTRRPE